jgi:hypothetical protein
MKISLDGNGNVIPGLFSGYQPDSIANVRGDAGVMDNLRGSMASMLDVLIMLGCKNVCIEPRDNDPKQVRRAVKRHGNNASGYRYHVLVVRPPGAGTNTKGEEIGTMPRHVCRGHFAEYGPEFNKGLLFGKYAGRFYVPPHLKGKKENGTVEKDYELRGKQQ